MMGLTVLRREQVSVFLVYNCIHCGAPLLTAEEDRRTVGVCGDCENPVDVDAFDPYGQPICAEVRS